MFLEKKGSIILLTNSKKEESHEEIFKNLRSYFRMYVGYVFNGYLAGFQSTGNGCRKGNQMEMPGSLAYLKFVI